MVSKSIVVNAWIAQNPGLLRAASVWSMRPCRERRWSTFCRISSVLGGLPVVRARDIDTIPHKYRAELCSGAHRFDHFLARADPAPGSGDGCPLPFVNSRALGWSRDM